MEGAKVSAAGEPLDFPANSGNGEAPAEGQGEEGEGEEGELVGVEVGANLLDSIADFASLSAFVYPNKSSSAEECDISSQYSQEDSRLSLAYANLASIPRAVLERSCSNVHILDVSHNKMTDLSFLAEFKNLTSLILDNNPISENSHLPLVPRLQLLWMNHCRVSSLFPWVKRLRQSCPKLQHLSLMGNPAAPSYLNGGTFYEYLQYRLFVISLFPSLVHLDDRTVTKDQRNEARRLYRRPLFERLLNIGPGTALSYGYGAGPATRSESSAILSSAVPDSALTNWKALHGKVAAMFDNIGNSHKTTRNLLV